MQFLTSSRSHSCFSYTLYIKSNPKHQVFCQGVIWIPKVTRITSCWTPYLWHICGHNLSLVVSVIQEGSSGERAGAGLVRGAYEFLTSQTLCLLDSLSSLQVGILHLSCQEPKDSKRQIQLCCCFPRLAVTTAACNCAQGSQAASGRFPAVKELE